jgi:hypothetical protein
VEKELRRDLALAKNERNIPLAGNEEEQAKVMGRDVVPAKSAEPTQSADAPASETPAPDASGSDTRAPAALDQPGVAQPADGALAQASSEQAPPLQQSTVGEVNVVRPAIDSTLQAAQSLMPQSGGPAMPEAEMITSELGDGLTAVATISSLTDLSLASSKPRLPLSQRPYYKVLIKGEALKPKAGRADDFAWPPS